MVTFVPMSEELFEKEFSTWVRDYAQEKIDSGNWKQEEALEQSRKEHLYLLPEGVHTEGHHLFSILNESQENVGMIWFGIKEQGEPVGAFIWKFEIYEKFRRCGYASASLTELRRMLAGMGVKRVSLHVFASNRAAVSLYEKMGYEPTNIVMARDV